MSNKHERTIDTFSEIDWDSYDFTTSPGADMAFPDLTQNELILKAAWVSKKRNDTSAMQDLHIIDLNEITDGETRRLLALYGIPVEWPTEGTDEDEVKDFIEPIEDARKEQSDEYQAILSTFGMLNEEHYLFCRNYTLGTPSTWDSIEDATMYIEEIDALKDDEYEYLDLMDDHGIIDENQYLYIKKQFQKQTDETWTCVNDILANTRKMLDGMFEKNKEGLVDELAPYKGISMESWALCNVQISKGDPVESAIQALNLEMPEWDDISSEWNNRMARDKTTTIAMIYGKAFAGMLEATAPAETNVASDTISFEQWVKILMHSDAATSQGIDTSSILAEYDLDAATWGTIGGHWSQKINLEPQNYLKKYSDLSAKYTEMFAVKTAADDVEF